MLKSRKGPTTAASSLHAKVYSIVCDQSDYSCKVIIQAILLEANFLNTRLFDSPKGRKLVTRKRQSFDVVPSVESTPGYFRVRHCVYIRYFDC